MRVVMTGGGGFLGQKLARAILEKGTLNGPDDQPAKVTELVLADMVTLTPEPSDGVLVTSAKVDVSDAKSMSELITPDTASVIHLAAVVSAQAEADFDLGMRVNLDGTRTLLEACRALDHAPRFLTTSSVAVFGGDLPDAIPDDHAPTPGNSYGAQKAIGELLVGDYSRKGFVDGRVIRLPTVVVRPGKPNAAASSFASSIVREPMQGEEAICPVEAGMPIWIMSPRAAIKNLIHAHDLPADIVAKGRTLIPPGLTVTIGEIVEALDRAGGEEAIQHLKWEPDLNIINIVGGWPGGFESVRGRELGFQSDASIDAIIQAFVEDDMVTHEE